MLQSSWLKRICCTLLFCLVLYLFTFKSELLCIQWPSLACTIPTYQAAEHCIYNTYLLRARPIYIYLPNATAAIVYVLLVEVSHLEGFSKYLGYFIAPLLPMLPTSTLFCAKEMETKIRPAFAHFSLRAKKISKMEDYRSSIDCFLSVFPGLVLWMNLLRY